MNALDEIDSKAAQSEEMSDADAETLSGRQADWTHPDGLLDIPDGVIACQFCGFTRFRRSKVRLGDISEFVLLRLPVRCLRCNQRQHQGVLTSVLAIGPKSHGPRLAKGRDTWKNWTEQEMGGKIQRPMSTALGPRAMKLRNPYPNSSPAKPSAPHDKQTWRDEDREIW